MSDLIDIKIQAKIKFLTDKGLTLQEATSKIQEEEKMKLIKYELRKLRNRELSRNHYRKKQAEKGLVVKTRTE
jgi:transposase-like protein